MASNRNIRSARSTRRFEREDGNSESDKELDQRFSRESANNKIQEQLTPLLSNLNSHWQQINKAIVAGIFIAGIGAGKRENSPTLCGVVRETLLYATVCDRYND
jgi:hypothetical protein